MPETDNPEKYISIEYNEWINKYKPLQEENERLKQELEDGKIKVVISASAWRVSRYYDVGYIDISVKQPFSAHIKEWAAIEHLIRTSLTGCVSRNTRFLSHSEVVALIDEEKKVMDKINERIKSIPRIIRWLFKIKK